MGAEAEEVQELGRDGVIEVKTWLEATTFLELQWNVYENPPMCTTPLLKGRKKFDLSGYFLVDNRQPVFIECKKYTTPGGQHKEYRKFLAIAYSATLKAIEDRGGDSGVEFLWVTFSPFQITEWKTLESHEKIVKALEEHPELLDGREVDDDLVRKVAERVWVLVLNKKQKRITLSHNEIMKVLTTLERKASTL